MRSGTLLAVGRLGAVSMIAAQGCSPLQRHHWWRSTQNLCAADTFADDHISELLETALSCNELNIGELASFEAVARRCKLRD